MAPPFMKRCWHCAPSDLTERQAAKQTTERNLLRVLCPSDLALARSGRGHIALITRAGASRRIPAGLRMRNEASACR